MSRSMKQFMTVKELMDYYAKEEHKDTGKTHPGGPIITCPKVNGDIQFATYTSAGILCPCGKHF
jgi:hypothetical protein